LSVLTSSRFPLDKAPRLFDFRISSSTDPGAHVYQLRDRCFESPDLQPFRLGRVRDVVRRYCLDNRHPAAPKLAVECHPIWRLEASADLSSPGVYILSDPRFIPLYLGKASVRSSIGARIRAKLRHQPARWGKDWIYNATIIRVSRPYEAPSLEEFLLGEIPTKYNVQGRTNFVRTPIWPSAWVYEPYAGRES
jgi:hypothetical protein